MKPYNLLDERWIPVVRASGSRDWIRPCDVCVADDPVARIATGRPDFDGSLLQFLIGLLQTAAAPESESDWRAWYGSPPPSSELHHRFDPHRDAFNLTGDGPLFMQDTELEPGDSSLGIERLLIDAAGDNTVRHNADLFIKRERVEALSLPAAAAALFTLQANAPSGGQGHRTSLRGGGPMTTLVVGEGLWKTTWLNVLNQRSFRDLPGETRLADFKARYPWMGPTKTSAHDEEVLPSERHPATHYWAMPRRIRLAAACEGVCGILRGGPSSLVVARYATEPRGENYGGAWLHPLTPYARAKPADLPNPKKPQPGGIAYKDWPHVALGDGELRSPARVVWQYFAGERYDLARADRLWAFGYDMDNMKARCWYSALAPLLVPGKGEQARLALASRAMVAVNAAALVRKSVWTSVRNALHRDGEGGAPAELSEHFWSRTEPGFFETVRSFQSGADGTAAAENWLRYLSHAALTLFDDTTQQIADLSAVDLARVARARRALQRFTSPENKKLRRTMELS